MCCHGETKRVLRVEGANNARWVIKPPIAIESSYENVQECMLRKNLVVTSITTYPLISNLTLKLPELPQFAGSTREVIARQLLPPFCDT